MEMMFPAIDNLVCGPRSRRCRSKREKGKTGIIYLVLISTICSSFVRGAMKNETGDTFCPKTTNLLRFIPSVHVCTVMSCQVRRGFVRISFL